jgi:Pre-toxin TG/Bacterial Ig domain
MRSIFIFWVTVVMAAAVSGSSAAGGTRVGGKVRTTAPGPVSFKVISSGKPVADCRVELGGRYACTGKQGIAVLEGVPAGAYDLRIRDIRFNAFGRKLIIVPGKRPQTGIALTPVKFVKLAGAITDSVDGKAVTGVNIRLIPVAVPAFLQGRLDFHSDFDGKFGVLRMPTGKWRVELSAPGYAAIRKQVVIADAKPLNFVLARTSRRCALSVTVKNGVSGKAVAGAELKLCEAYPEGLMASGRTSAAGTLSFKNIRVGLSRGGQPGKPQAMNRELGNLYVSAPGYNPALVPVALSSRGRLAVRLFPLRKIDEAEPNDGLQNAQAITVGTTVKFKSDKVRDHDHFKFRITRPSTTTISVAAGKGETYLHLFNDKGKVIAQRGSYSNKANTLVMNLMPGSYIVRTSEWGDNHILPQRELSVSTVPTADPGEPNGERHMARPITPGCLVRGYIFPTGDKDFYRFELKRPSRLRLDASPSEVELYLVIRNAAGKAIHQTGKYTKRPARMDFQLAPGNYTVEVTEWGNNSSNHKPYSFVLVPIGDDGVDEVARRKGSVRTARTLKLDCMRASTILPVGDSDRYSMGIPSKGYLKLSFVSANELYVLIRDRNGKVLRQGGSYANKPGTLHLPFYAAQMVEVEVTEWGNNGWGASPYMLWSEFAPADEQDMLGDETRGTAYPLELGQVCRGTIFPVRDHDWYRFHIDHPGRFELKVRNPVELYMRMYARGSKKPLRQAGFYANRETVLHQELLPGEYVMSFEEWGNNGQGLADYQLKTKLYRGDRRENKRPGKPRYWPLKLSQAQQYGPELVADRDAFSFSVPAKGDYELSFNCPFESYAKLYNQQTGAKLRDIGVYTGIRKFALKADGPTRYSMQLEEWGRNRSSFKPGFVMIAPKGKGLPAGELSATVDRIRPRNAVFTFAHRKGSAAVTGIELDADGDGRFERKMSGGKPLTVTYPREGLYCAQARLSGEGEVKTLLYCWVRAEGQHERKGIYLSMFSPAHGQLVEEAMPVRCRAVSYEGTRIRALYLSQGGRRIAAAYRVPYEFKVPWERLAPGKQSFTVTAVDTRGKSATLKRNFNLSSYFNLLPEDGAVRTGNSVRVTWHGGRFGTSRIRYRQAGQKAWKQAVGRSGVQRVLRLSDLEAGKAYEYQPLGGTEPGPVRTVTRVKGLAFGQSRYGGNIKRDYDQKLGISVRNHSEKPMAVILKCGKPRAYKGAVPLDSKLLVGFVGHGSEDVPFKLGPGEEREFFLGMSAQDVLVEDQRFPVRITSQSGYADEAEVRLTVKLPVVKLEWKALAPVARGLGQKFRLTNKGDTLTDLDIDAQGDGLSVTPAVRHGLFRAGRSMIVTVLPDLYAGFKKVDGKIFARALARETEQAVSISLPEGEQVFGVQLIPGMDPRDTGAKRSFEENRRIARSIAGAWLDAGDVDWSTKTNPQDSNGDGKVDRWEVDDQVGGILWVGEDTDADGKIDFVHADIGSDGQVEYAAYKTKDGWDQTNLVEAWLEMGFSLPWKRGTYHKHDLDLVFNGTVVASITDSVPEGNYRFKLPPSVIKFQANGAPAESTIQIRSKHLRGGHYVVNSDFRIKLRMTGTRAFVVGPNLKKAVANLDSLKGLSLSGPDYSVSSGELRVVKPRKKLAKGDVIIIEVPLRNVGASHSGSVAVALLRAVPGGKGVELTRKYVRDLPLIGETVVRLLWKVAAGNHALRIVVDPDKETADTDWANNEAIYSLSVPGDDAKPTLKLTSPAANFKTDKTVVEVKGTAGDDSGIARVEVRIDGGLWKPLRGRESFSGKLLLQPGRHNIEVRAIDSSGNIVASKVSGSCNAKAPEAEMVEPKPGQEIDGLETPVEVKVDEKAVHAAARFNGGPWQPLDIKDGKATGSVPVEFGAGNIETMVVGADGAQQRSKRPVRGKRQPTAEDKQRPRPKRKKPPKIKVPGFGDVNPEGEANTTDTASRPETPAGGIGGDGDGEEPGGPAGGAEPPAGGEAPASAEPPAGGAAPAGGATGPTTGRTRAPRRRRRPRNRRGGFVSHQKNQKNWYCTNRPNISTRFTLPDWLRRKKMPKPGTKEFKEMREKLLAHFKAQGIDTSKLEKFQKYLMKQAGRIDQPGDLPGFLESLGFKDKKVDPKDKAALAAWRKEMQNKTDAWFLRLLASGDSKLIAQGLKARADIMGKYDGAMQDHANAVIQSVEANQKLTEDLASGIPLVGDAMDIISAVTGETLSGEKLSGWQRLFAAASVLGPEALGAYFKNKRAAREAMEAIADSSKQLDAAGRKALSKALKKSPDEIGSALDNIGQAVRKNRDEVRRALDDKIDDAARTFDKSAEGLADAQNFSKAQQRSWNKLENMDRTMKEFGPKSKEFRAAALDVQSDKLAQNLLVNGVEKFDSLPKSLRKGLDSDGLRKAGKAMKDDVENVLYKQVDDLTTTSLKKSDDVKGLARKHGVEKFEVEPMKVTHTGGKSNPAKIGRDRDVTYQLVGTDKHGRKVKIDIDHKVAQDHYGKSFYKKTKGDFPKGATPDEIGKLSRKNLDKYDQTVTSGLHPEAYNTGEASLDSFLRKGDTPTLTRVEDVADTFVYKSDHWFKQARNLKDPVEKGKRMAEGMRQATKQWKSEVLPRMQKYFDLKNADQVGKMVHPDLNKAIGIMKQVEELKISPKKAEQMLASLKGSPTPETIVKRMGAYLEGMEKTAGKKFRAIHTSKLKDAVKKIRVAGPTASANGALKMMNDALVAGKVTGTNFVKMRGEVFGGILQNAAKHNDKGHYSTVLDWLKNSQAGKLISQKEAKMYSNIVMQRMKKLK